MDNSLTLKKLIDLCNQFTNEEIDLDTFKTECDKFFVNGFISLRDKIYSVMYVLFSCEYSEDLLERFMSLEMNKFWYIILRYCGIDATMEQEYCTEENYDLLRGLVYDPIMTIIKNDYSQVIDIFNQMINYINFKSYEDMFSDLINTDFSKLIEADKAFFEDLKENENMIKDLADITRSTNPTLKKMEKIIDKQIINNINNNS